MKTIETRSWATKHRGPVLICSAARRADRNLYEIGRFDVMGGMSAERSAGRREREGNDYLVDREDRVIDLPLGAALGVATIVDCLPIVEPSDRKADREIAEATAVTLPGLYVWNWDDDAFPTTIEQDITDQLPYGDFTPGRFAWMLEDIRSFAEPIQCRGGNAFGAPTTRATRTSATRSPTPSPNDRTTYGDHHAHQRHSLRQRSLHRRNGGVR